MTDQHGPDPAQPLVSMIMPVWQPDREWLFQAVRSALAQRGCRIELVVVDDGCERPVEELLSGITDQRLRVVRVPHGGAYRARNAGIAACHGDYIRFVDSDDVCEPDSTAHLLELAAGRSDLITYGATRFCDEELRPIWTMVSRLGGWVASECLRGMFTVRFTSMLFPRRVIELTGDWDPSFRISGDWDFVLRTLDHAPVLGDEIVASRYRRHSMSMTADIGKGEQAARVVVGRYFERHPEQAGSKLERQAQARVCAIFARVYANSGPAGRGARPSGTRASARSERRMGRADPVPACAEGACAKPACSGTAARPGRTLAASNFRPAPDHGCLAV